MRDWRILQLRLDFATRSRQTKITLWWGAVKLQNSSCRGCGLTTLLTALLIHAPQIKIPHPVKNTWIGDFLNRISQDFGRIGRHEVVRIHQLPPTERYLIIGIAFVLYACFPEKRWWIRTARAPRLRPAGQKCPSGAFLGRGLRIHQLPPKKIRNLGCGSFFVLSVGRTPFKQKMCRPKGLHNYFRKRSRPYRYHSGNCGILHGACP